MPIESPANSKQSGGSTNSRTVPSRTGGRTVATVALRPAAVDGSGGGGGGSLSCVTNPDTAEGRQFDAKGYWNLSNRC